VAKMTSIFLGGKYPKSALRHRNANNQTHAELFQEHGLKVITNARCADIFIAIDHNESDMKILKERIREDRFNFLLRSEPKCVIPEAYRSSRASVYSYILTFGRPPLNGVSEFWPQFWPPTFENDVDLLARSEKLVVVNANKLSLNPTEMYTFRRKCFAQLPYVDLYGESWNTPMADRVLVLLRELKKSPFLNSLRILNHTNRWFRTWPLTTAPLDKLAIAREYKYSLVVENDLSYMSEKLFDSLFAGCITLYVGPDIRDYGIPDSLVLQVKPTINDVERGYNLLLGRDPEEFQSELKLWLSNPEIIRKYSGEEVMGRAIATIMKEYAEFTNNKK
jgi:hypothetical protein